jgi:type IV pilus assembly protein PilY1
MELRLNGPLRLLALLAMAFLLCPGLVRAQATYAEDFTRDTLKNSWYASGGTCLTAGNLAAAPASPPTNAIIGCVANLTAYYQQQSDKDPALVGGFNGTFPDPVNNGALRFTNGSPSGQFERGSLVSGFTFPTAQGVSISFNTVTYLGDGGGDGKDGADGISFFLMDACVPLAGTTPPAGCTTNYGSGPYTPIGANGGSLGYSCNNGNPVADGVPGAYLGLGIDEYGNFLNGVSNTLKDPNGYNTGGHAPDNTIDGGFYDPGRIGLRGAGNVNWQYLNNLYGTDPGSGSNTPYYPGPCAANTGVYDAVKNFCETCPNKGTYNTTTHSCPNNGTVTDVTPLATTEMQKTCSTGFLYNYSNSGNPKKTTTAIADYSAILNGFTSAKNIGGPIAAEGAATRGKATPIVYNLQITPDSKLSFQLSYNGGAFKNILTNTDFSKASGAIPHDLRFGFTGATGGSTNIHELLCFQAAPNDQAASGAGNNNFQNPQLIPGEQLFLGSYFPTRAWAGAVTAQSVTFGPIPGGGGAQGVIINKTPVWDASCVLTKLTSCPSGAPITPFEAAASRQILTFDQGTAYYFNYNLLPTDLQNALDGDDGGTGLRVNYLRGDQTNELSNTNGVFRTRTSVLGDVIDSTPTLVGPPSTYPSNIVWTDFTQAPTTQQPEGAAGVDTYATFQSNFQTRTNVVYVGANDGMLHGFRAGAFDSNNSFLTQNNDGYEVLAYMPGAVASTIHNTASPNLDPSSPQYTHAYFVDATAATGDVFYGTHWHTWVVGGLGAGAIAGIYALDVTDPTAFADPTRTLATVIGEWTPRGISGGCGNASNCGDSMGSISGVPQIRRFHDGKWGVIFGNGTGSTSNDAGIFIMLLDQKSGKPSFLYLSTKTGSAKTPNGIVSASAADIDGDHIVDFVYAGDLLGNVWRFDLTDSNESNWKTSQFSPIFTEPHGLPITTKIVVSTLRRINLTIGSSFSTATREGERVILGFGTGRMIPQTPTAPTQYAAGPHYIYGIWDADMSAWNNPASKLPVVQPVISFATGTPVPTINSTTNLQVQTITTVPATPTTSGYRTVTQNGVCWPAPQANTPPDTLPDMPANCKNGGTQMGWFMQLPGSGGTDPALDEQIIFDPIISADGEFIVNTFIPANTSPLLCQLPLPTGFTMALNPGTGGGSPLPFFFVANADVQADGIQLNGTGVPLMVQSGQSADSNAQYLLTQTSSGQAADPVKTNRHTVLTGERLNWVERR